MSPTDLAVIDRGFGTTIAEMQARRLKILQVMANVLEEGKDYGRIPGTDKPTLFKSGAEQLCLTFELAPKEPTVEDLSSREVVRYRVSVGIEAPSGRVLAVGIGECSSDEEKYRWRKPVCDEEYDETPPELRRLKWFRGKGGDAYQGKQLRTSPADLANTVLKMGHKRALIAATLLATGASSVFNQDVADFAEELRENVLDEEAAAPPKQVHRTSERQASGTGAAPVVSGKIKDVRVFGKDKNNWAITLVDHKLELTTKDPAHALELERFKGTDHILRIAYVDNAFGDRVYHNVKAFVVEPTAQPPATTPPPTAAEIPFGR